MEHSINIVLNRRAQVSGRTAPNRPPFDPNIHFWPFVDASAGVDACHIWKGSIDPGNGYGRVWNVAGVPYPHRVAWELANGCKIPKGKLILHSRVCTSKLCCNHRHLRIGSQAENMLDAIACGRLRERLEEDEALEVYDLRYLHGLSYTAIARIVGVSNQCVSNICRSRTWRFVPSLASRRMSIMSTIAMIQQCCTA